MQQERLVLSRRQGGGPGPGDPANRSGEGQPLSDQTADGGDTFNVALGVAALPARGADGFDHAEPPLPSPEGAHTDPGPPRDFSYPHIHYGPPYVTSTRCTRIFVQICGEYLAGLTDLRDNSRTSESAHVAVNPGMGRKGSK